jgi:hypothetical protein
MDENSVFSNRVVQTSTLNQFRFLLGNAAHIKAAIPSLRRSALFELFLPTSAMNAWKDGFTFPPDMSWRRNRKRMCIRRNSSCADFRRTTAT